MNFETISNNTSTKRRHAGIELMRIIAMFLVVVSHVLGRVQSSVQGGGLSIGCCGRFARL